MDFEEAVFKFYNFLAWDEPPTETAILKALSDHLEKDFKRIWHGPDGVVIYNTEKYLKLLKYISNIFESVNFKISHVLVDSKQIGLRYAAYTKDINDDVFKLRSHFFSLLESSGNKIYRMYDLSAPGDGSLASQKSYLDNHLSNK